MVFVHGTIMLPALAAAAVLDRTTMDRRQLPGMPKVPDFFGLERGSLVVSTPFSVKKLQPEINSNAIRERVMFGPFSIRANNASRAGDGGTVRLDANSDAITSRLSGLCQNCMVLKAAAEVVNHDDMKVGLGDGLYGHHVLVTSLGQTPNFPPIRADSQCEAKMGAGFDLNEQGVLNMGESGKGMGGHNMRALQPGTAPQPGWWESVMRNVSQYMLRSMSEGGVVGSAVARIMPAVTIMIGEGGEATPTVFASKDKSVKSGYWIAEDHRINAMAEIINYNSQAKDVFLSIDYEYLPNIGRTRPADYHDMSFGVLGVSCGKLDIHPDKDRATKFTGLPVKVLSNGYLMGVIPHLHDGGINMTLFHNGKAKCTAEAIYGGSNQSLSVAGNTWETITSYQSCDYAIPVKAGDELLLETVYDLTQHKLRPSSGMMGGEAEGMGLALFTFAKERPRANSGLLGLW